MAARQPKLCFSTLVSLAYCKLMAIFTCLILFDISENHQHRKRGMFPSWLYLSDWTAAFCFKMLQRKQEEPPLCPLYQSAGLPLALWGWFNCEGGWRRGSGPGVSGSTLFSHPGFLGPWRWGSMCQIKSHSQVSLPAVMYIHRSSRCLPLLEIYKKVNC